MKIAFLSFYNSKINRGVETVVFELAQRLGTSNDVTVFQSGPLSSNTSYKVKYFPANIDWNKKDKATSWQRRLFIDYWSLKIAIFTIKCLPVIYKEKFDIVVPFNGGWQPALIRLITWLYGGKMIISGQTGIGWDEKNNLLCFPNAYVALNTFTLNWAKKFNKYISDVFIPNGVDLNKFTFKGPPYKVSLKRPIILTVGAFTKQKRLDLVIKAVAKIKNTSLLIVGGSGDLKEELENIGINLLGERFQILRVPYDQMPLIYRSADIFTLPSASSEAFGNVLIEAMASGLPVVATDDPIRREIVGDAGIFVDPTNTEEYALALRDALNKNFGNIPRRQAEKFSWEVIAQKYENLFQKFFDKS